MWIPLFLHLLQSRQIALKRIPRSLIWRRKIRIPRLRRNRFPRSYSNLRIDLPRPRNEPANPRLNPRIVLRALVPDGNTSTVVPPTISVGSCIKRDRTRFLEGISFVENSAGNVIFAKMSNVLV